MNNWVKNTASPFGDPNIVGMNAFSFQSNKRNEQLHNKWRHRRSNYHTYVDPEHSFHYQGAAGAGLNTYKMFLEASYHYLKKGGRLGILVPSGVYTDQGSTNLRSLFLNRCSWEWLFVFINSKRIFDIHSQFKFAVVVLEKGGSTDLLKISFNRFELTDLEDADVFSLDFPRKLVEQFSPQSLTIVGLQTQRDLKILDKLYNKGAILLGDQSKYGWELQYNREFNMTDDSALFPPVYKWEDKGYQFDSYKYWVNSDGIIALPLYEGRMIGQFDPCKKGWVSGKGRAALWQDIPFVNKVFEPQFLIALDAYNKLERAFKGCKIGFMSIGSATNARSMYACMVDNLPCGHSIATLKSLSGSLLDTLALEAILNSFAYDYTLRSRLGGLNLSQFVLDETPLIPPSRLRSTPCAQLAARLNLIMPSFAPQWLEMRIAYPHLGTQHWRGLLAITRHERLRLRCILDAIIAELYGLEYDDFAWILRDDTSNSKGFWRVDKDKPKELRHTTLALAAFERLKEMGLEAFCKEDWEFPVEIGAQLGPRFTAWQEEGSVEESWAECETHALRMKETPIPLPDEDGVGRTSSNGSNGKKNGRGKVGKLGKVSEDTGQLGLWEG